MPEYIVKVYRYGGGTSVVYRGLYGECVRYAEQRNAQYQADTYRVERFSAELWGKGMSA